MDSVPYLRTPYEVGVNVRPKVIGMVVFSGRLGFDDKMLY